MRTSLIIALYRAWQINGAMDLAAGLVEQPNHARRPQRIGVKRESCMLLKKNGIVPQPGTKHAPYWKNAS